LTISLGLARHVLGGKAEPHERMPGPAQKASFRFRLLALLVAMSATPTALAAPAAEARQAQVRDLLRDPARLSAWLAERSPDVKAARARVSQSEADVGTSRLFPNPVLDATLSNVPIGQTTPAGLGLGQTLIQQVGLSETIELGKRGPRIDAAELRERSAQSMLTSTLSERMAAARFALARVVYLSLRVSILEESLKDAQSVADLERTRFEQKALSGMDYDRLLVDLAGLRADVSRSRSDYQGALLECGAVMSAPCDPAGATDEDLAAAAPVATVAFSDEQVLRRPDLQALELAKQASERDADLARRRAIPDVTVHVGYTYDRFTISGDNANTLAFSVALPLPIMDHGQHDAARALGRAQELSQTRNAAVLTARSDLGSLVDRKAALEKNLEALERDSIPRSSGVLSAVEQAFRRGGASMTDLILARRTHIAIRVAHVDQRFELFAVRNNLRRVLGLDAGADTRQQ
jgi:outer membrane protein, heavy metal efflux system